MNGIKRFLLPVLGLVSLSLPLSAQSQAALGSSGEVYVTRADAYGKLFPGKPGIDPTYPVLVLEIASPGAPTRRLLVPETEGIEVDTASSLLFEETSQTLFVAWESREVYPVLKLAGFDGETWSAPVSVIGNPWAVKTSAQMSITHDSYLLHGETEERDRTILHVVWGEQNGAGVYETFYSPVLFENGAFSGKQPPVYSLDGFERTSVAGSGLPEELIPISRIVPGRHGQSLVVAFASPRTNHLVNLEIDVLPAQLGRLSDEARMHIIEIGAKYFYPSGYKHVADDARMHIIEIGVRGFQPEVAQAMADKVGKMILDNQGTDKLSVIADKARMHIIEIGAKLSDRGLRTATSSSSSSDLEIAQITGQSSEGNPKPTPHLLNFRVAATWNAPEVGSGPIRYFPAKSGEGLLVAWAEKDRVKYRETQGTDWSHVKEIALSSTVSLARAYQILEERMSRY